MAFNNLGSAAVGGAGGAGGAGSVAAGSGLFNGATTAPNGQKKPLQLMDETFDFTEEPDEEVGDAEEEQEVDPVSDVLLTRFGGAPIPAGGVENWRKTSRILRFKLNPNGIDGVGFISQDPHSDKTIKVFPEETRVYTTSVPTFNDSPSYSEYVSNLFSIYEALGDERYYSVPTIGLIKRDAQRRQSQVLNKATTLITKELEIYIERKQAQNDPEASIFELEECLSIINCLKAVFFAQDHEVLALVTHWVNSADPQPDQELAQSVMGFDKPYTHPYFWKFIQQLTLRGLYEQASAALNESGYKELQDTDVSVYNLITDAIHLLQSYPQNASLETFKQWRTTASTAAANASKRNPDNPLLAKSVGSLLNIISGNRNSILENSSSWYEALVGLLTYHIPSAELLQEYFQLATEYHSPDRSSIWELASLDIFEGNFLQMLRAISSFSTATAAYVSALCEAKGLLKGYSFDDEDSKEFRAESSLDQDLFSTNNVSEFLLHSHALDCLTIEKLIPVGIGLLASSTNPAARSVVAEYLPKYNFKTNDDIEWALTICASLKLPQIAHVIFRTAAQRSLSNGMLLEALVLFSRAGEVDFVKYHTWLIFENSLLRGGPIDDRVINAIVDDTIHIESVDKTSLPPLLRQTLAPYAVLYQFWRAKKTGSQRDAFKKAISLLTFPHLPPKLFGLLISQILPFIVLTTPPRTLLKDDLIQVIKILNKFEEKVLNKTDAKAQKLKNEADELYKYSIADETMLEEPTHWLNLLQRMGIKPAEDLKTLLQNIRRGLAEGIARSFLEESYN